MTHPNIEAWRKEGDLQTLQVTIHDGVPEEQLRDRGRAYRDAMFGLYPRAAPGAGARVLEIGPGVGWIMESVIEAYPDLGEVVGLDVSPEISKAAYERWSDPRAHFVAYDGLRWPFADGALDVIYSCAAIQHVEKHWAFFIFSEAYRALKPGGHAVLHLLSVHHIPHSTTPYEEEARHHVEMRTDLWWHHYYSYDELFVLLSQVIGVDDLDIKPMGTVEGFCVHFSKQTGHRFADPEVERLSYPARLAVDGQVAALEGELELIKGSRAWKLATSLRSGWHLVNPRARQR
jgi:ubiquinone/menaquinone biosynthesis C-methylase UbiE